MMVVLEPEDEQLLAHWQAILDRVNRELGALEALQDASAVDYYFHSRLMQPSGQMRSDAHFHIEDILRGREQWHRDEQARIKARKERLALAKPGDILHHIREGDFLLVRRNKEDFRVRKLSGGAECKLPQGDFLDATLAQREDPPTPSAVPQTLFDS